MPIPDYGFWKGKPVSYKVDGPRDRTPHITLVFKDNDNDNLKAAINVKSQANPSELVYWFDRNFSHPLTRSLSNKPYALLVSGRVSDLGYGYMDPSPVWYG